MLNPFFMFATLFAQEPAAPANPTGGVFSLIMMVFVFLLVMYMLVILPKKSQEKQAKKMIDRLKKNDKVMTSAGIIGTIFSVDREQGEVVLKVDDSTNTKIHFSTAAIYYIFPDKNEKNKEAKDKEKEK